MDRDNADMADGMRYLFDSSCALHNFLFQCDDSNFIQMQYDPKLAEMLPEEEKEWRLSLTIGSQIDAVKID